MHIGVEDRFPIELLAGIAPPVVIVPVVRGAAPLADIATRLRRQLGVLE